MERFGTAKLYLYQIFSLFLISVPALADAYAALYGAEVKAAGARARGNRDFQRRSRKNVFFPKKSPYFHEKRDFSLRKRAFYAQNASEREKHAWACWDRENLIWCPLALEDAKSVWALNVPDVSEGANYHT